MEDFLLFEMPVFHPNYKKWKKYGYTNLIEKNKIELEVGDEEYLSAMYAK